MDLQKQEKYKKENDYDGRMTICEYRHDDNFGKNTTQKKTVISFKKKKNTNIFTL